MGHRPKRLVSDREGLEQLGEQVRLALEIVRAEVRAFAHGPDGRLYAPGAPRLVAVTSLAEGADRIVADAALKQDFELCCPMPFPRAVFERDFDPPRTLEPESRACFAALIERARAGAGLTTFETWGCLMRSRPRPMCVAAWMI